MDIFCNFFIAYLFGAIGLISVVGMWVFPKKWITVSKTENLDRILNGTPVKWVWLNNLGKTQYLSAIISPLLCLGIVAFIEYNRKTGVCI